jgi:hypothetical protein
MGARLWGVVRSYRLWKLCHRRLAVLLLASSAIAIATAWTIWLQAAWASYLQLQALAALSAILIAENYAMNVCLRRRGGIEMNPIWAKVERFIKFSYVYPAVCIAVLTAAYLWIGQFGTVSALSGILPANAIFATNDALSYLDGADPGALR